MIQRLSSSDLNLNLFTDLISTVSDKPALAASLVEGVPVYSAQELANNLESESRSQLLDEWAEVLLNGAGVFAITGAVSNEAIMDQATTVFQDIIAGEKAASVGGGDHFATAGNNDRIWNSLEKHALSDPANFAAYYANPWIDAAAEAWLGPRYQMTAQANLVRPGGQAQTGHRDYHLGCMSQQQAAQFPAHVHAVSATLTLQGAIAHVDMPVESGPTKLLPHSQKYELGYLAFHDQSYRDLFEDRCVQLPLKKGDLLWFNPALFHGAGANHTRDVERLVNLFQVSSAFGRPMESVDREAMLKRVEPLLSSYRGLERQALVRATAEGYAFPTNLDTNPPVGGLAPETDQDRLL